MHVQLKHSQTQSNRLVYWRLVGTDASSKNLHVREKLLMNGECIFLVSGGSRGAMAPKNSGLHKNYSLFMIKIYGIIIALQKLALACI